jgi:cell division protein FtsQ
MGKRVGANNRKKITERKVKLRSGVKTASAGGVKVTIVIAAISLAAFACVKGYSKAKAALDRSSYFTVSGVQVQGASIIPAAEIIKRCGIKEKMKTYKIKTDSVTAAMMTDSRIESVKLIRKIGGGIVLKIIERKPVALVNLGVIFQVDRNGMLFPLASGILSDLPIVSGVKDTIDSSGRRKLTCESMNRIKNFFDTGRASGGSIMNRISQINFLNSEKILVALQSHSTLIEMSDSQLAEKFQKLINIEYLLQNDQNAPARINLCYSNLAFVTNRESEKADTVRAVVN